MHTAVHGESVEVLCCVSRFLVFVSVKQQGLGLRAKKRYEKLQKKGEARNSCLSE